MPVLPMPPKGASWLTTCQPCLNRASGIPWADEMASRLHMSTRTLHRRLDRPDPGVFPGVSQLRRRGAYGPARG